MAVSEEMAYLVAADIKGEDNPTVVVDPSTIMAIISVIVQVVKLYQECKKSPAQAKDHLSGINGLRGWWSRRKLWNLAKQEVQRTNSSASAEDVYNGLLRHAQKVTISDMTQLYLENP